MSSSVERFQNSQWVKLYKLNFSKSTLLNLIESGTVLDIGCGDGLLLERLKQKGLETTGIDISSQAIAICKERGLDCRQGDITDKLPFPDNSFDNVLLVDVLEHIFQPREVLKEANRVCRGHVFISVPNFTSLPARLQVLAGRVPENNTPRDGHVYWMTRDVIFSLLRETGFDIEQLIVNTFWAKVPIVCVVTRLLASVFPSVFGLSFIIKAKKGVRVGEIKK